MDNLIANLIAGVTFVMTRHYLCLRSQRIRGVLFHFSFNKFNEDNALLFLFYFCLITFCFCNSNWRERNTFLKAASFCNEVEIKVILSE